MKQCAITVFDDLFPGCGEEYESILYVTTQNKMKGRKGWDFYQFRQEYKQLLSSFLQNMKKKDSNLASKLSTNEWSFEDAIKMDTRLWEPSLWPLFEDAPGEDEQDVRDGTFSCGNCARKNAYARNTSHIEKQTRSSDEPMTVFMHCHTCGKDYRFSS